MDVQLPGLPFGASFATGGGGGGGAARGGSGLGTNTGGGVACVTIWGGA